MYRSKETIIIIRNHDLRLKSSQNLYGLSNLIKKPDPKPAFRSGMKSMYCRLLQTIPSLKIGFDPNKPPLWSHKRVLVQWLLNQTICLSFSDIAP